MWFFVILLAAIGMGLSRRPAGLQMHLSMVGVIIVVVAYASLKTHAI